MSILELKNVSKKYPKFNLKDVSFEIEPGCIMGFIGRNGAGKTTTLKGIMNLIHFDSGEVYVFGHPFFEDELENRQHIAFSLSELNYFPQNTLKSLTNVTKRFYKYWNEETYQKLSERFGLDQNKKVCELSSGMKVKYNLAIALSHDAKILILDEPTSGLDPVSRDEILDIFEALVKSGERSILFSTHITSDLEKCASHITYIRAGEIIASSKKEDFVNNYRIIECSKDQLSEIEKYAISVKKSDNVSTCLVEAKDLSTIGDSYSSRIPSLEEVMIYYERGKEDEELII